MDVSWISHDWWVGTNMLRWLLVEMRKRIYIECNEAPLQSLENSLSYKNWVGTNMLEFWWVEIRKKRYLDIKNAFGKVLL